MIKPELAKELFVTGFTLGWGPCLAYCGAILVPYLAGTKTSWIEGLKGSIVLSAGRLAAYVLLGAVAGLSGRIISYLYYIGNFRFYVRLLAGAVVLVLGISTMAGKGRMGNFCKALRERDRVSLLSLGFLIGLSPCAPLMGVLTYLILKCNTVLDGIVYGLAFGIGTTLSPIVILGTVSGILPTKIFVSPKIYLWFQRICGAIIIYFAFRLIFQI